MITRGREGPPTHSKVILARKGDDDVPIIEYGGVETEDEVLGESEGSKW